MHQDSRRTSQVAVFAGKLGQDAHGYEGDAHEDKKRLPRLTERVWERMAVIVLWPQGLFHGVRDSEGTAGLIVVFGLHRDSFPSG
jgi:hypothetical protein